MSVAFVFPGQGSQTVGMGKALAENFAPARAVFDEVDDALGEKLTQVIWEGPSDDAHADRKHPAGAAGDVARGGARPRSGGRPRPGAAMPNSSPGIRSASIRPWRRRAP